MVAYFQRLHPGQTRFGVYHNLFDHVDRETIGGWYLHVHCWPFQLEVYGQ